MTRGMPSLAALLGLLAIAGYQNRDKIGELLKGVTNPGGAPDARELGRVVGDERRSQKHQRQWRSA